MRYTELQIETQRKAPAQASSQGAAYLRRAGYTESDGKLTALGRLLRARLAELAKTTAASELFAMLALPNLRTQDDEWFFPISSGRQVILQCPAGDYTARRELARFGKTAGRSEASAPMEKVATPDCHTIEALAEFLNIPKEKTAKALMYARTTDNQFIFVVIRGDLQLSEDKLLRAVGKTRAATIEEIIQAGAVPGYASPIGLQSALVIVDDLVPASANLASGANESDYHYLNTNYGRDYSAATVTDLAMANAGDPCPICGAPLAALNAEPLTDSRGIHEQSVITALADVYHDENGLTWPPVASPFDVHLLNLAGKELDTKGQAIELHDTWQEDGLTVLLDDRDARAGVKFADADLIGCPVRATIGERGMRGGMVEFKLRSQTDVQIVPFADAVNFIRSLTPSSP